MLRILEGVREKESTPSPIAAFHVRASRRILHEKLLVITNANPTCCSRASNTEEPTLRVFGMLGVQ
jgi:hypothetical protein